MRFRASPVTLVKSESRAHSLCAAVIPAQDNDERFEDESFRWMAIHDQPRAPARAGIE